MTDKLIKSLTYVDQSPIHGRGLFARVNIKKGTYIGTYQGRSTQDDGMHVLWLWDEDQEEWTGIDGKNQLRFTNHSDTPNAEFWDADMYALKKISRGEEITFDYQW